MNLQTSLRDADRIYKMYANRLEKLNIFKLEDFLYHIPFRYDDYSKISKARFVQPDQTVTIQGIITEIKNEFTRNYKKIQTATIEDESGTIEAVWFNQPFLLKTLHKDDKVSLSGKVGWFLRKKVMQSPEYELLNSSGETIHTARLVPVYPETHGVSSKWLRRQVYKLLTEYGDELIDVMPEELLNKFSFLNFKQALWSVHFPKFIDDAEVGKKGLAFDELFFTQLSGLMRRQSWKKNLRGHVFEIEKHRKKIEEFWKSLPFELTKAQLRTVHEILSDVSLNKPMNRLLEGDVGSGKTVVATIVMYLTHLNGFQSVLMAPTEILANQHYATIKNLLEPLGVNIALKTGSSKYHVSSIKYDVLIGTHAVLTKNVKFDKLGLVVIDEQQRFGVEQRSIIREKGNNPHLLTMTATPIPRTIALTMYGDLDLSVLDEMPKGRKIIKTWLVPEEKRSDGYEWVKKQISENSTQAFIVCPFIEESETMASVKSAVNEFEKLKKVFGKLNIGLLHGKMKAKEKDLVLQKFRDNKVNIIVATPVVEVGIDFPNAAIMIIEASERFGLAGLHQLRGRVGRGNRQSYCLLFTDSKNPKTIQRLKSMEDIQVGAELAELDLRLRGPGDVFGTKQHGLPNLKIATFSDFVLIERTRHEAEKILQDLDKYPKLKEKAELLTPQSVSPD